MSDNNIIFLLEENSSVTNLSNINLEKMFKDLDKEYENDLETFWNCVHDETYYGEFTVKELLKICSYYGIDKDVKATKCKKNDIVSTIIYYESLPENYEIVEKRVRFWEYIDELLNDDKMKKYILWN
jgi:hypothetical protein